jgi:hypothetical protein
MKNLQEEEHIVTYLQKLYKVRTAKSTRAKRVLKETISYWEDKLNILKDRE